MAKKDKPAGPAKQGRLKQIAESYRMTKKTDPRIGLILGTGLGGIAEAVHVFREALIAKEAADASAASENAARERRVRHLDALTSQFEANISALTRTLAAAATEMEATAGSMTSAPSPGSPAT